MSAADGAGEASLAVSVVLVATTGAEGVAAEAGGAALAPPALDGAVNPGVDGAEEMTVLAAAAAAALVSISFLVSGLTILIALDVLDWNAGALTAKLLPLNEG